MIYLDCDNIAPSLDAYCAADFCGTGPIGEVCAGDVTPGDAQGIFRHYLGYLNPCGKHEEDSVAAIKPY